MPGSHLVVLRLTSASSSSGGKNRLDPIRVIDLRVMVRRGRVISRSTAKNLACAPAGPDAAGRNPPAPPANAHPITARQTPRASAKARPFRRSTTILGLRSSNSVIPRTTRHAVIRQCAGQRGSWAPTAGCASAILATCASGILTRPGAASRSGFGPWPRLPLSCTRVSAGLVPAPCLGLARSGPGVVRRKPRFAKHDSISGTWPFSRRVHHQSPSPLQCGRSSPRCRTDSRVKPMM
jgi:hypothetical protein